METITRFDSAIVEKANRGIVLASAVLPAGRPSLFDHAWRYLNGLGAMEPHKHRKEDARSFTKSKQLCRYRYVKTGAAVSPSEKPVKRIVKDDRYFAKNYERMIQEALHDQDHYA